MSMPSLFDSLHPHRARVAATRANPPLARTTDPATSRAAVELVQPGNSELIQAIRWYVSKQTHPVSAYEIADALCGLRWQHDTIRSAVSRAGLHCVDAHGTTPRGRRCTRYVLRDGAA